MRRFFNRCCLALAITVLLPGLAEGQRGRNQVKEGNRLYDEGRFDEAHQKYLEALLDDPDSPLIRFNDGNALYRGEDFQQAMERFLKAAESEDPALRSAAWYNLGNALYRQQKLQESLEAYKEALRANPSDVDSKYNLERVLEQLQQQEQSNSRGRRDRSRPAAGPGASRQQEQEGQEPQDQESPQPQGEQPGQEEDPQEENSQEGQAEGQPQPGEMTPEEAERLLSAIREDPGEVNRQRVPATGKRPRKDW